MATYRYPLNDQESYRGTITFRPVQYIPPEVSTGQIANIRRRLISDGALESLSNGDTISEALSTAEGADRLDERFDPTAGVAAPTVDSPTVENVVEGSKNVVDYSNGVILYLPSAIGINDAVSYENFDLGIIGGLANNAMQQGSGVGRSLSKSISQATGSMVDVLRGGIMDQRAARLGAARLAEALPGGDAFGGAARNALGVTVNPNTINLFKSVNLREFSFSFKMIATSKQEAEQIEQIVKFFRTAMYPDAINFSEDIPVPIGYEFPDKFQITMQYRGRQVGVKILNSVLRGVQTNLNATSQSWHADSKPTEVDITLSFGEERTLTRQDIIAGY